MSNFAKVIICLVIGGCAIYYWKYSKESDSRVAQQKQVVTPADKSEKEQNEQEKGEKTKNKLCPDGYEETALGMRKMQSEDSSESVADGQELDDSSEDENVTALGVAKTQSDDIEDADGLSQDEDGDNEQGDWLDEEEKRRSKTDTSEDSDSRVTNRRNKADKSAKSDEKDIAGKRKRIAQMQKSIENNKRKIEILNFRIELHEKCRHCYSDVCKRRSRGTCLHSVSGTIYGKNYKATHRLPSYGSDQTGIDNAISALNKRAEGCQRNIELLESRIEKIQHELGEEVDVEQVEEPDFSIDEEIY